MKDILLKINLFYEKPNLFFSFLFQNKQLVLIYGSFDPDRQTTEDNINLISSELSNQTSNCKSIKELTGYSIHSLLFGGLKQITKDSFLYYSQFGNQYFCKPYKFVTLNLTNASLEDLLEVFVNQRLIITFSSLRDLSLSQISLFFFESSKKAIVESVKIVRQKLNEMPKIKGQLESIQKSELRASPTKSMFGLNDFHIKLNSMLKWLSNLNQQVNKNNIFVYPKIIDLAPTKIKTSEFMNQNSTKQNIPSLQHIINKNPLKSIFQSFEFNNWNLIENISTTKFSIIKLANNNIILILVLSNKLININKYDFTAFFSKGFNLVFISSGGDFVFSYEQVID